MSRVMERRSLVVGVVAVGLVLSIGLALRMGAGAADTIEMLVYAAGGSLTAAVFGAVVLRRFRRRSVRTQAVVIATAALLSTVAGVTLAAALMFISTHDLGALLVVLAISAAVGLGAAVQMGAEVDAGARRVRDLAHRLGSEPAGRSTAEVPSAAPELVAVAEEVVDLPRRLEEMRRRADALERSRHDLVTWVSHDLRSPLATLRAMAEALDDGVVGDDEETLARYHHQIRRNAERLSALVDDLFELSRVHSGQLQIGRDRVRLNEVVDDVLASSRHRAELEGIRLVDEGCDEIEVEVAVAELGRVLHNVVDNAIRHTPPGGEIRVRLSSAGGQATISVEDQCGGIPVTDLDRVFDVAFRGDAARSPGDQGGGLGLAIAKGLVEACSGSIAVDNASAGCCFTVRLPLPA